MAWADTTRKAKNNSSAVASLNVTLNSTVASNHIIAVTSCWGNPAGPTSCAVSDGANGTYSVGFFLKDSVGALQSIACNYKENGAGGNLTITSNPSGATADSNDMSFFVHEFSGGATTSSVSGTASTGRGSSTTAATGNTTPGDNDCLLIAGVGYDGSGTITENGSSEGFSLSNESDGGTPQPGSMVFKILSGGSGAAQSESWTLSASAPWVAGIIAFKPTGGGVAQVPYQPNYQRAPVVAQ